MNTADLLRRYEAACDFDRPIDHEAIERLLITWWRGISDVPMTARHAATAAAVAARDAWTVRDAWAVRPAWDAVAAWDAWDVSWHAIIVIGAASLDDRDTYRTWLPLFEAYEAGLWLFYITETELIYLTLPEVHRDDENRLHREDGPAFVYGDIADYYVHGVRVTQRIVDGAYHAEDIDAETNAEVRRVMLDRYGVDRYIRDTDAIVVHRDAYGTLWHKPLAGDEDIYMVEVINATSEPDGSRKHYWLRVDPRQYDGAAGRVAQAAVASTWRFEDRTLVFADWRTYAPAVET